MKTTTLIVTALLLAGAASAQQVTWDERLNDAFAAQRAQTANAAAKKAADLAKLKQALSATLTDMADMGDDQAQSLAVANYVNDKKVSIDFADIAELSSSAGKAVTLSTKIEAYPRPMGIRIAWEVAGMMLADMPASVEKEYMRRSITARAFVELNGEPAKLPVVETLTGAKDDGLSAQMKLWLDNDRPTALKKIAAATNTKSLQGMDSSDKAVDAAITRYTQFCLTEMNWRQLHP